MPDIYFGESVRSPFLHCPVCGKLVDGATRVSSHPIDDNPAPEAGSVTLCMYCAAVLIFENSPAAASKLCLSVANPEVVQEIFKDPIIKKAHEAIKKFIEIRKRPIG